MPIISVWDNENDRKKKWKKEQRHKRTGGMKAIVKKWEPNDFVVRLS